MDLFEFLKQLLIVAIGGCAALIFAFYLVWPKIESYLLRMHNVRQHKSVLKDQLQLRFAAYERLVLLVHRISPQQTIARNRTSGQTVQQLRQMMVSDIEQEFQHNFTQQLYVSDVAWSVVSDLKMNTVALLNNASADLDNTAVDAYVVAILRHLEELDVNPYNAAPIILKRELNAG